jgi:hypothetical protein
MNGCIWGQTKGEMYSKRHKGINLEDEADRITHNIHSQIPLLNSGRDYLLMTRNWKTETKMVNIMAAIGKQYKLSPTVMNAVCLEYIQQGKNSTCFGAIDALTRVSQTLDNEVWVAMDTVGGLMLTQKNWATLNAIGKTLDDKEVIKLVAA